MPLEFSPLAGSRCLWAFRILPRTKCGPNQTARVRESLRRSDPTRSHDRCLLTIYVPTLSLTPDRYHRSKHRGPTPRHRSSRPPSTPTGTALPRYRVTRSIAPHFDGLHTSPSCSEVPWLLFSRGPNADQAAESWTGNNESLMGVKLSRSLWVGWTGLGRATP